MSSIRSKKGYILIEILISAAIVAMVLATSVGSFYSVSRSLGYAETTYIQVREARNIVARIRAGVDLTQYDTDNWTITVDPQKGGQVRYHVTHRDQPGLTFSVDKFGGQ